MNVLSIETSTRTARVAYIDSSSRFVESVLNQGPPSAGLLKTIDAILNACGKTINDVDLFVVDTGPGSFTGIRIGLSTVYALSYALSKPAVGVNAFEVIGCALSSRIPIIVWIDSKQGDVYHAMLLQRGNRLEYVSEPRTGRPEELLEEIVEKRESKEGFIFAGDGALKFRDLISLRLKGLAKFAECSLSSPSALILGMLGLKKFKKEGGDIPAPVPYYLKNFSVDKKLT